MPPSWSWKLEGSSPLPPSLRAGRGEGYSSVATVFLKESCSQILLPSPLSWSLYNRNYWGHLILLKHVFCKVCLCAPVHTDSGLWCLPHRCITAPGRSHFDIMFCRQKINPSTIMTYCSHAVPKAYKENSDLLPGLIFTATLWGRCLHYFHVTSDSVYLFKALCWAFHRALLIFTRTIRSRYDPPTSREVKQPNSKARNLVRSPEVTQVLQEDIEIPG